MKRSLEADTLKSILQYLEMRGILYFRMNSGDRFGSYKGKTWRIRGHQKGTADILCFPKYVIEPNWEIKTFTLPPPALWIECKSAVGKQSLEQKHFQARVEERGHKYVIARSLDDVTKLVG